MNSSVSCSATARRVRSSSPTCAVSAARRSVATWAGSKWLLTITWCRKPCARSDEHTSTISECSVSSLMVTAPGERRRVVRDAEPDLGEDERTDLRIAGELDRRSLADSGGDDRIGPQRRMRSVWLHRAHGEEQHRHRPGVEHRPGPRGRQIGEMNRRRHADDGTLTTLDTLQLRTDSHADRGDRGRPGRPLLRGARPAARPERRDHRLGAQRAGRHVRLRRGLQRRDARRHRARRPGGLRADAARVRDLGRHRRPLQGRGRHQRRARVRGDEPAPAARDPPGALPRARRRRSASAPRRPTSASSPRRTTWSSPPTALNSAVRARYADTFRPDPRRARLPLHLARHRPGLRRLQVLRPRDAVRRDADPRLPVRRHRLDVHRRDDQRGLAARRASTPSPTASGRPASPTRSRSR